MSVPERKMLLYSLQTVPPFAELTQRDVESFMRKRCQVEKGFYIKMIRRANRRVV